MRWFRGPLPVGPSQDEDPQIQQHAGSRRQQAPDFHVQTAPICVALVRRGLNKILYSFMSFTLKKRNPNRKDVKN